ncbi:D-alanyl-D-alanine endopeptidase [Cupriavidus taiwanensis]|uniref:Putative D-Alanyl-D-alanine carboxypeptidase n=1 Tax=Cupriavidus taiwanensis TaxID=164546 RepID=A0A7Z7J770_9BURK|nr:D-alanyl-D-alanine endopeptidase [Cupriavidus taiwanensis]SOY85703.1 putative D-Alanyl-D-alanine carboxypeptidase [Cupriavidus taiwanensis]SOZ02225.1 putative D-Alanyl-D-alanine carboxypeptidase [Cupriavidus taiwanensis]SOZ05214.1 putative D-Alanyl-D-alanine carboxypeptidase [Cupriavidus taiwanensis]SPC09697.1 putative D-Alanyl-D-alanine carboxypeptidase [Cupriavidus taiwanensis]SPD39483.1 Murein-DD-endopeptidase. Serine peptidase. MEROPS family S11 [Cupriavidus taiwanensis]
MFRSDSIFSRFFGSTPLSAVAAAVLVSVSMVAVPVAEAATKAASTQKTSKKQANSAKTDKKSAAKPVAKSARNAKVAKSEAAPTRKVVVLKNGKRHVVVAQRAAPVRAAFTPSKPSLGEAMGLRDTDDALALRSSVALVMDQNSNEVLFQKNASAVLPIASITKLMTALVVMDSRLPMDEVLTITEEDRDTEKHSSSRLRFGTQLTRQELLLLALMSSENRAASALGRHYPGGLPAFVQAMNRKARELGMNDSHFVDSSGLSSSNVSSATDLVRMVNAAYRNPTIREFSTQTEHEVNVLGRTQHYVSTNRLVRGGNWEIGLQKTGFISEAGQCLVMQARVQGRNVVMVFLDSAGKLSRFADANRVKDWLEHSPSSPQRGFPSSPNLTQGPGSAHAVLASQQSRGI